MNFISSRNQTYRKLPRLYRTARGLLLSSLFLFMLVVPAQFASADDETDEITVEVKSVLEAVNCDSIPQTVSVLGLAIDIDNASIEAGEDEAAMACSDLLPGQTVEVSLVSDLPDPVTGLLTATGIEVESGDEDGDDDDGAVEILAPIQSIDPLIPSITVLGLVVDISQARLEGEDDDDDDDGEGQPIDITQLVEGQYVEMQLVTSQPPFVATSLEVKNFGNEVEVEVIDEDGVPVDDGDTDDLSVDALVTTKVKSLAPFGGGKRKKKLVSLHMTTSGSFVLNGLPTGRARISVVRTSGDGVSAATRTVRIKGNRTKHLLMRLKPVK